MNNPYLKIPDRSDEKWYLDYINEFKKYDNDTTIFSIPAKNNYKLWLYLVKLANNDIKLFNNIVPQTLYFLVDDSKIIGHISICHQNINYFGGHMGGSIRPTLRNKGYGKILYELGLEECSKYNFDEIIMYCDKNNISSNKIIVDIGGKLDSVIYDPFQDTMYKKYKVKVKGKEK